jgi:hypothetical protein
MRVRIVTSVLGLALAAGCSGGGGAASGPSWAAGSHDFVVHVEIAPLAQADTLSAGRPLTMLVDTATGAFRISGGPPGRHSRPLTVSDGRDATQVGGLQSHPVVTVYRGSSRYLADRAGGTPLRVVEAFLAGAHPPPGVRVRVLADGPPARLIATTPTERIEITLRRAARLPVVAFRTARGRVPRVARELRADARPDSSISASWLGRDWKRTASGRGGWYTLAYPRVDVELTGASGISGRRSLRLSDGTRATLQVARVQANGTVSVSSAGTSPGTSVSIVGFMTTSTARPGSPVAFVFLPHAVLMLSGSAVTPRSAPAIARSLRPL